MNKKLFSLGLGLCLSSVLLTGCGFNISITKDNKDENANKPSQSSSVMDENIERAYAFFHKSASQYEKENKIFVKDYDGVGFIETVTYDEVESIKKDKLRLKQFFVDMLDVTKDAKEQLNSISCNADFFYKVKYNGEVIIDIRNGYVNIFNLGDDALEEEIMNELLNSQLVNNEVSTDSNQPKDNSSSNTNKTPKKVYKTCKYCGKSYEKKNSDAVESDKYCSSECYTEARMSQRNKDAKTTKIYYCKDCGTKISKSQYNSWKRCPSCARTHDKEQKKEYICKYCGRGYTSDEAKANNAPSGFCSEVCAVNWEGRQHENWENHHGYDSNGRVIPCEDHCGDGCE